MGKRLLVVFAYKIARSSYELYDRTPGETYLNGLYLVVNHGVKAR